METFSMETFSTKTSSIETSVDDRFSLDNLRPEGRVEGLPPFPDLDSASDAAEADDDTGADDDAKAGTDSPEGRADPGPETAEDDTNDDNDTADPAAPGAGISEKPDVERPCQAEGSFQGYLPERAVELLPALLKKPARRITDRRERDVFLTGALPIWAAGLPNVRFCYGGEALSPNLYSATVAPPASGKSALRYARRYGTPLSEELRAGGPAAKATSNGAASNGAASDHPPSGGPGGLGSPRFFLAGDTSAAAIKDRLARSPHGVICETEFRTLGQALGSSWGGFSDVLLKGFQNEPIHMDRSSKPSVTISHPAPSIALAGTPATFDDVISGTADGLFSRFLLYRFDRAFEWSSQFGGSGAGPQQTLREAAAELQGGYHRLRAREEPLYVTVPGRLQAVHNRAFESLTAKWQSDEDVPRSVQASLFRAGLQAVKIAVVLRGIRLVASAAPLGEIDEVALTPADMEAGLRLALTYLLHGIRVEARFRKRSRSQGGVRAGLTERKRTYLEALPGGPFSTKEAKELASTASVSERNAQRWLKAWAEAGLLTKLRRGTWAKVGPQLEGTAGAGSVISVIDDIPLLADGSAT